MGLRFALFNDESRTSPGDKEFTKVGWGAADPDHSFLQLATSWTTKTVGKNAGGRGGLSLGCGDSYTDNGGGSFSMGTHLDDSGDSFRMMFQTLGCLPDDDFIDYDMSISFDNTIGAGDGWIEDGCRLYQQYQDGTARGVLGLMMKGLEDVQYVKFNTGTSYLSGSVTYGFKPTLVFMIHYGQQGLGTTGADAKNVFGVAHNNANNTLKQLSWAFHSEDSSASNCHAEMRDDVLGLVLDPAQHNTVTAGAFTSMAMPWTLSDAGTNGQTMSWALKLENDDHAYIGIYDTPLVIGETAEIVCGFQPGGVMILQTQLPSVNVIHDDGNTSSFSFGQTDFTTEGCFSSSVEENDSPSAAFSDAEDDKIISLMNEAGVVTHAATIASRTMNGFTLNFTVVDENTPRKFLIVAIKGVLDAIGVGAGTLPAIIGLATGVSPSEIPCDVGFPGYLPEITGGGELQHKFQ